MQSQHEKARAKLGSLSSSDEDSEGGGWARERLKRTFVRKGLNQPSAALNNQKSSSQPDFSKTEKVGDINKRTSTQISGERSSLDFNRKQDSRFLNDSVFL